MANKKTLKLPPGSKKLKNCNQKRPHFDYVDDILAEEHYGKYLIVTNTRSSESPHNRLYLVQKLLVDYLKAKKIAKHLCDNLNKRKKPSSVQLLSTYPEHKELIWDVLSVTIEPYINRSTVELIVQGFGLTLNYLHMHNQIPNKLTEFNNGHVDLAKLTLTKVQHTKTEALAVNRFFNQIAIYLPNLHIKGGWPKKANYEVSGNEALPLHVVYQLDYHAQKELNDIVEKATEYNIWMDELEKIELFSLKNLAHTFYKNIKLHGSNSNKSNALIRKLALTFHNVDLKCWERRGKDEICKYGCKEDKLRHENLLKVADLGIDINLDNEKMFAMWHKVVLPEYPYKKEFASVFRKIWSSSPKTWRNRYIQKLNISASEFDKRIFCAPNQIYPLYLIILIRTGLNQEILKNWNVIKDENGDYKLGEETGFGLMIDGEKKRGNSIQTAIIGRGTKEKVYIDFFLKWLTPLYDRSKSNHFFQYINTSNPGDIGIEVMKGSTLDALRRQTGNSGFYNKNNIRKTTQINCEEVEERITWVNHQQIRPSKNFSDYLKGYSAFKRQRDLGHKGKETEPQYYRNSIEWKNGDTHKIAATQQTINQFFKGTITSEDNPKLKVFDTPMANCSNQLNPTYPGAPKLKVDEVCTNWRKCLTQCDKCSVIPKIHGPVIMAWRNYMDEIQDDYYNMKDWEKEFSLDYEAAQLVLNQFKKEDLTYCETKASAYATFIKKEVITSQKKRKVANDE